MGLGILLSASASNTDENRLEDHDVDDDEEG